MELPHPIVNCYYGIEISNWQPEIYINKGSKKPGGICRRAVRSVRGQSPISPRPSAMPRITMPAMTITTEIAWLVLIFSFRKILERMTEMMQ